MCVGPIFAGLVMTALAISLLVGLVLLLRGLRGRRIGDAPYCRKCGYNLTGLESDRCPECGRERVGRNVVIGRRRRRRASLIIGVGLILVSSTGLCALTYVRIRKIDPYPWYPKLVLVRLARFEDAQAVDELARRIGAGQLAANGVGSLIPVALDRQPPESTSLIRTLWRDLLGAVEQGGGLTSKQRERFYRQLVTLTMEFRPRIRQDDSLVVHLSYSVDQPEGVAGSLVIDTAGVHVGSGFQADLKPPIIIDTFRGGGCRSSASFEVPGAGLAAGKHRFEFRARQSLYAEQRWGQSTSPVVSEAVTISGEITVLPIDGPGSVTLVEAPGLAAVLRQIMSIVARQPKSSPYRSGEIEVQVDGPTPIGAAFQVVAEVDTRSLFVGTMTFGRSEWHTESYTWPMPIAALAGEEWHLVLRPSVAAAEQTLDLFEVWDGELRFGPFPIQ
ncbi:MAG: hypothetical protein GY778_30185 [bacterium]|nr:hypothetical protein [bacterium]